MDKGPPRIHYRDTVNTRNTFSHQVPKWAQMLECASMRSLPITSKPLSGLSAPWKQSVGDLYRSVSPDKGLDRGLSGLSAPGWKW